MYIKVQVVPGSAIEKVDRVKEDEFRVYTKAKAERNQANIAVVSLLKEYLGITRIRIVSGHHNSSKIFDVEEEVKS